MKIHKEVVMIEMYTGYLEIISFYETKTKTFGVDIFDKERLTETIDSIQNEPGRDHMLSIGFNYMKRNNKAAS